MKGQNSIKISHFVQNGIFLFLSVAAFGTIAFALLYSFIQFHFLLFAVAIKDICLFVLIMTYILCLSILLSKTSCSVKKIAYDLFSLIIFFSVFFLLAIFKGHSALGTILIITRRYYLPLFVLLLFIAIDIQAHIVNMFVYMLLIFVIIFGIIEYISPVSFWDTIIQLPKYWKDSGDRWAVVSIAKSGRFMTWDLFFLFGRPVRRMCSAFAEPTNFSSFCISGFIIFRKHKIIRFLCFVCCCLAVSKAALMVFFGLLPVLFVYKKIFRRQKNYGALYIVMFVFFFCISALMYNAGLTIGPFSHIAGFYTGAKNVLTGNIFGYGIGATGNYFGSPDEGLASVGSESGIGGMLGQCGLGAFFYVAFFYKLIKILQHNLNPQNYDAIVLIFAWTVICIFSESAFGASGNILFFIYPAMAVRRTLQAQRITYKELSK